MVKRSGQRADGRSVGNREAVDTELRDHFQNTNTVHFIDLVDLARAHFCRVPDQDFTGRLLSLSLSEGWRDQQRASQ